MTQHHSVAPVHRLHNPAHMHIGVAKLAQLAHILAILPQAHNRKVTFLIWRIRSAHIQNPRPIRQLHRIVDMHIDADMFVDQLGSHVLHAQPECAAAGFVD